MKIHRLDRPFKNRLHDDGDVKRVRPPDDIGAMGFDMNIQNAAANGNNFEADEQLIIHAGAQQHVQPGFDGIVFMSGRAKLAHGRGKMLMPVHFATSEGFGANRSVLSRLV